MIDIGEDWSVPIRVSIVAFEAGLMYLPILISLCMTFMKWDLYCMVELQLGGVWVCRMLGKSGWKPRWRPVRICSCLCSIFASHKNFSHVSGL